MEETGLLPQLGSSQRNGEVGGQGANVRMLTNSLTPAIDAEVDNSTVSTVGFDGLSTNASSLGSVLRFRKIAVSVTQWLHNRKPVKYKFSRGKMIPIDMHKKECHPECGHGICAKGYFSLERRKHFKYGTWKVPVLNGHYRGPVLQTEDLWFLDATHNPVDFLPYGIWDRKDFDYVFEGPSAGQVYIRPDFLMVNVENCRFTPQGKAMGRMTCISVDILELMEQRCFNKIKNRNAVVDEGRYCGTEKMCGIKSVPHSIIESTIVYYCELKRRPVDITDADTVSTSSILRQPPKYNELSYDSITSGQGEFSQLESVFCDISPLGKFEKNTRWIFLSKKRTSVYRVFKAKNSETGFYRTKEYKPAPHSLFQGEFRFNTGNGDRPKIYRTAFLQFRAVGKSFADYDNSASSMTEGARRLFDARKLTEYDKDGNERSKKISRTHDEVLTEGQERWLCILFELERAVEVEFFLSICSITITKVVSSPTISHFTLSYDRVKPKIVRDVIIAKEKRTKYERLVNFHAQWRSKAIHQQCCRVELLDNLKGWFKSHVWAECQYISHRLLKAIHAEEPHPKKQFRLEMLERQFTDGPDEIYCNEVKSKVKKEIAKPGKIPRLYTSLDDAVMYAPEFSDIQKKLYGSTTGYLSLTIRPSDSGENCVEFDDNLFGTAAAMLDGALMQKYTFKNVYVPPIDVRFYVITSGEYSKMQEAFEALEWSLRTPNTLVFLIHSDDVTFAGNNVGCRWHRPNLARVREMVRDIGYNVTCENTHGKLERFQFLKNSPVVVSKYGRQHVTYARNYGAMIRNLGTVYGDLTADKLCMTRSDFNKLSDEEKGEKFMAGVINGFVNEPSSPILNALRTRFCDHTAELSSKIDTYRPYLERIGGDPKSDPRGQFELPYHFDEARYGILDHELTSFLDKIESCRIGDTITDDCLSRIYATDYGLGENRLDGDQELMHGPFGYNLDIESCDSSNSATIFVHAALQQSVLDVEFASEYAAGNLKQCTMPTVISNPSSRDQLQTET